MYKLVVAWRYLWSRLVSYIGAALLAMAVMLFIVVMAVMEGMGEVLRSNIRKSNAHIELIAPAGPGIARWQKLAEDISGLDHVLGVTPFVVGGGQVQSQRYRFQALIRGVDIKRERIGGLGPYLEHLSDDVLTKPGQAGMPRAVAGYRVVNQMELEENELIRLSVQQSDSDSTGRAAFEIADEFKTESLWFDRNILISLEQAQKLFGVGDRVTGLGVWLDDYRNAHKVKRTIQLTLLLNLDEEEADFFRLMSSEPQSVADLAYKADMELGPAREFLTRLAIKGAVREVGGHKKGRWVEATEPQVKTWAEQQPDLFRAMAQEAWIMRIILCIVIMFVGVLIFCLLWVMVDVKVQDIGILSALGARTTGIVSIFVFDGLIIGIVGSVLGGILGSVLALNLDAIAALLAFLGFNVFPEEMFYGSGDGLPSVLRATDIILVTVVTIVGSFLASVPPAIKAARQEPIESLRHEQ